MKDNFIHIAFILDESGSMYSSAEDVKGSFKEMIDEQKNVKNGECAVSLYKFNSSVKEIFLGKDVNEIESVEYTPRGTTAMNDGIGTAIDSIGVWLANMNEEDRPSKNLIVIMTDGMENASVKYSFEQIKEMIKHQEEKYNWSFAYMGTDISSLDDVKKLGIKLATVSTRGKLSENYKVVNDAACLYRNTANTVEASSVTMDWLECKFAKMSSEYEKEKNVKLNV